MVESMIRIVKEMLDYRMPSRVTMDRINRSKQDNQLDTQFRFKFNPNKVLGNILK